MDSGSITPFQRRNYGRAALMSIIFQYAGPDKWMSLLQACDSYLHLVKWKSNNNFTVIRARV